MVKYSVSALNNQNDHKLYQLGSILEVLELSINKLTHSFMKIILANLGPHKLLTWVRVKSAF